VLLTKLAYNMPGLETLEVVDDLIGCIAKAGIHLHQ
jgi:hypothetical protein